MQDHFANGVPIGAPKVSNIIRNINYARQQDRPAEPTAADLGFTVDEAYSKDVFLVKDIYVPDSNGVCVARHLVFATSKQLQLLAKAKTWYMDATFKIVATPFHQLFSISAFIKGPQGNTNQVPLVFALMSRRRKEDYKKVLKAIKQNLPSPAKVKKCVMDFEKAIWNAALSVLGDIERMGCNFHFNQAIFRRIIYLGLQRLYWSREPEHAEAHRFMRKLMSLPFLPSNDIPAAFHALHMQNTRDDIQPLLAYIEDNWINGNVFPPENWSVYNQLVRTNNDKEGYHRSLNTKGRANMSLYVLWGLLRSEADNTQLLCELVRDAKMIRNVRLRTRQIQGKLQSLWDRYADDEMTPDGFLDACSLLNGVSRDFSDFDPNDVAE